MFAFQEERTAKSLFSSPLVCSRFLNFKRTSVDSNHEQDSPAAKCIAGREVTPDPGSRTSLKVLGSWIRECATEHKFCPQLPISVLAQLPGVETERVPRLKKSTWKTEAALLPPRVIDVGPSDGSQEPYLLDTTLSRRKANYITLSHCWGKLQPLTTTTVTYQKHVRSLPMTILPATFRDAVIVTRALRIRYLWIDSLCIMQDSEDDWKWHCAIMGAIYARSFLSISAAGSPDSTGGCFIKNSSSVSLSCVFRPTDSAADIHVTEFVEEVPFSHDHPGYTDTRAWCLQETALPTRVVAYGTKMMGWLCDTKRISQQHGEMGTAVGFRLERAWDERFRLLRWAFIVNNYTERHLTYEKDKLVALAGLAGEIQAVTKDDYLAGIWRTNLVDGLLWTTYSESKATRPAQYRAPSWSWASLNGPIDFKTTTSVQESIAVTVLDWHIDNIGGNPLGEVSGGILKLAGPVAKLEFSEGVFRLSQTIFGYKPDDLKTTDSETFTTLPQEVLRCDFDIPEEKHGHSTQLWCLGMTGGRHSNPFGGSISGEGWGLLLVSAGGSDVYLRVGAARMDFSVFLGCPMQSITLI
jgi:hypothetical protein